MPALWGPNNLSYKALYIAPYFGSYFPFVCVGPASGTCLIVGLPLIVIGSALWMALPNGPDTIGGFMAKGDKGLANSNCGSKLRLRTSPA